LSYAKAHNGSPRIPVFLLSHDHSRRLDTVRPGDLIRYDPATREAKCPECVRKEERERGEKAMERMKMDEYTFRGAVLGFLLAICLGLVYIIGYLHLILQHIK